MLRVDGRARRGKASPRGWRWDECRRVAKPCPASVYWKLAVPAADQPTGSHAAAGPGTFMLAAEDESVASFGWTRSTKLRL
mmetsp:Transcript_38823/g.115448  ORF Transcript_38823/g.115448 Transcript_38823/m.115448 type:complete len:81 (-) Transcript_38823:321-563(-)